MAKLRTLSESYNYIKAQDPDTAITANALRRLVVSGQVPRVMIGKKYLLDMEALQEFLKGTKPEEVLPGYQNPYHQRTIHTIQ